MAKTVAPLKVVIALFMGVTLAMQELVSAGYLENDECVFNLNESETTFTSPGYPGPYNSGLDCTWNINVTNSSAIYLTILDFYVDGTGDILQVFDGNVSSSQLIGNFSKTSVPTETFMVVSSTNILIVKLISANSSQAPYSKRKFTAYFTTDDCSFSFDVMALSSSFGSIYYLGDGPGDLTCTWSIEAPYGYKLSLSFNEIALGEDAYVTIREDDKVWATYSGSGDFPDIFSNGTELLVEYVQNTSLSNILQAAFVVIYDCGPGYWNLSDTTTTVNMSVGVFDQNMDCRWLIEAPADLTLMATFDALVIQENGYVIFRDGPQRKSNEIGYYSGIFDATTVKAIPVILTTQKYLWIKLKNDEVSRSGNLGFTVSVQEFGRQYLQAVPQLPFELKATASTPTQYYRFSTTPDYETLLSDNQVELVFQTCTLSENATMSFYDGDSALAPLLAQYSGGQFTCNPVYSNSGRNLFLVVDGFQSGDTFAGSYSVIEPGCHGYLLESTGTFALSESRVNDSNQCSWTLKPSDTSGVLSLVIAEIKMAATDTITVYYGTSSGGTPIAKIDNSVHKTPVIFSSGHSTGPVFLEYMHSPSNSVDSMDSIVFSASYKVQGGCQKSTTATPTGQILSPDFPNQYPFNAQCFHKLTIPDGKLVHLYFDTFSLYEKHKVDIKNNTNPVNSTLIGSFSGDTLPNDIIFTGTDIEVDLSTVADPSDLTVAQGYNISYSVLECGGNLTDVTSNFSTPGYPTAVNNSTTCIWIISVPSPDPKSKNVSIVNMTFPSHGIKNTENNYIEIRDGPSLRSNQMPLNLTSSAVTILSTYNYIWVKYVFNKVGSSSKGFSVKFSYKTYVCSATCDNGICMHPDWVCDGIDQCGDSTDEKHCPSKTCPQSKGGTSAGVIILTIVLSVIVTVIVFLLAPRVKRWLITRKYSSMDSDVTERI